MTARPARRRISGPSATGLSAIALLAALVSCAEPDPAGEAPRASDTAAAASPAETSGSGVGEATGPDPASGVSLPEKTGAAAPPPDPRTIALEPAEGVRPDPALAADAPAGVATAYWGRRGRKLDAKAPWRSIAGDGIHDRESDAVRLLQHPRAALRGLPRANSGNLVDWVAALDQGLIRPRGGRRLEVIDRDVLLVDTKSMPYVIFPHRPHTEQLVCGNCHDWLFRKQAGTTEISMAAIARGRSCGLCHGKVAFPATECFRCHSGPRPR